MRNEFKMILLYLTFALMGLVFGYLLGYEHATNKYFSDDSEVFLDGYKLELPEEFPVCNFVINNGEAVQTTTLLYTVKNEQTKTIYVLFHGEQETKTEFIEPEPYKTTSFFFSDKSAVP